MFHGRSSHMKKYTRIILNLSMTLIVSFFISIFFYTIALAAITDITATNNETSSAVVNVGDTGNINPDLTYIEDQSTLSNFTYYFDSDNTEILTVDNNGAYTAIAPGTANINVRVYATSSDSDDYYGVYYYNYSIFSATIQFTVNIDMANVT